MKSLLVILSFVILWGDRVDRSISHQTYNTLTNIQKLLQSDQYKESLLKLKNLQIQLKQSRAKPYEKVFVYRMFGFVYVGMSDYSHAIISFENALEGELFTKKDNIELITNIARLYMAENRFDKALIYYKKYLNKTKEHKASTLVSIASVYNELDNKQKAIEYLGSAIKISKEPKLSWYEMLLGLYYNIADYTNSIITQESIIEKFGTNKKQLMTLVGLYQLVQNQQKALSTLELAYDMGYFDKEDDFVQLSYLWLNHGTPEKSARMLQKAIDKSLLKSNQTILKLLADSYSSARESSKALNTYKKLATLSQNGNIYAQIAQTYLEIENYHEAILFFTKAIESEDIKNIGGAYLLRGISYYNISNSTKARADFIKAKNYNKSAKNAQQWLKFI